MFFGRYIGRILIPLFSLLPISRLDIIKRLIARVHGAKIGRRVGLSPRLFMLRGNNIKIGDSTTIGIDCRMIDICAIEIGDECLISHDVTFISGTHESSWPYVGVAGPIVIGSRVWIGAATTIVGPCNIGDGAMIGANSFVRANIDPGAKVAGSPAKPIKSS